MKKIVIVSIMVFFIYSASGQRTIDRMFDKYADKEGFTCITVNGNLLNIAASFEDEDDDKEIKAKINEVRILSYKDHGVDDIDFYNEVIRNIDINGYEELMRVKESDQDLRVLVRYQGRRIIEFLLVAGGDDNAVIQVKGNMSVSDARKLCDNARRHNSSDIF